MAVRTPRLVAGEKPSLGPLYDDVRDTLQIWWVPAVFDALGEVSGYLRLAWEQLKPSLETAQFARLAERAQKDALAAIQSLYLPSYDAGGVWQAGVPFDNQAEIRTALAALLFEQSQTLLATKALRLAIENDPPGGERRISWPRPSTTWALQPIPLVDERSVGERERRVFRAARQSLTLPWVPLSLLLLARWPRYLRLAWNDLTTVFREPEFAAAQTEMIEQSAAFCDLFPTKVDATPDYLERHGQSHFEIARAREILLAYDRLMPADLLLTACLRYPLGGHRAADESPAVPGQSGGDG